MALTINFNGLTDLQWQAIFEFLNRYLVPNIVKEPGSPRGQIFNAYLEQINLVATGQLGIEDFLFNIGDIFPVAGEDNDRFRELAEQTQYNGFLKKFEEILASEDPASAIQGLFDRYENVGIADNSIILSELDSFGGINSFSLMNPQNVLDRVLIGDNDWGVTVQMCTTTVTTNCVDPKNIKDIWEDFGRHVQVIFKGLEIPGLPEWLPLPGIMRLPTIGEIWDRISGPFNDAAREQMRDCMSKDDDGDGVANTASYCIENRDIAGIITQGILDGTGELVDATTEAVKGIVDKALETLDCVTDPAACATKVKDTIEGIFKSADPTQPGLPDWMRVIIIGSQYGDKVLKELEKIFGSDIDGDGTIGITQEQFDCSTINRNGGVVEKEEDCGACLPNFVEVDGQCTNWTDTGVTAEECAAENREHIPSTGAGTNSACGGCLPDFQVNETGDCVASPIKCEGNQVLNETTGRCEDPPPDCTPGGPCTDETGASGTYDENCDCVADWINSGPSEQDCAALGKTHVPADDSTQTPSSCGSCEQEGWTDTGQSGECEAPNTEAQPCDDPEAVRRGGLSDGECVLPGRPCFSEPSKYSGDDANIDKGQFNSEGFCVAAGGDNGPDDTGGQCPADSERNGQNPVFDPRDTSQSGFFTAYTGITYQYDPCNPSLGYSIVGQNVNVCEDKNNQNYGNIVQQPEEPCGECNAGFRKEGNKCVPDEDNGGDDGGEECPNGGSAALHIDNDCNQPCRDRNLYDFGDGRGCVSLVDVCANPQTDEEYRVCGQEPPTPEPNEGDDCPLGDNPTGGVLQKDSRGKLICVPKGRPPPPEVCNDPNATNYEQKGKCGPCKDLYDKPEGYDECTLIETLCQDPDYAEGNELCQGPCDAGEVEFLDENGKVFCDSPCAYNDQIASSSRDCREPCPDFNGVEGPRDDQGNCYDCTDEANALICGWAECPDGSMAPTLEDCVAPECDNKATDYPDCVTCPSGQRINPETDQCEEVDCTLPENALFCGWVECENGTMAPTLGDCDQETPCSDPTYAANNPLECGWVECPDGSFAETREDCEETPQECANGATDYPDCTVCPEGQSMDAEGNCTDCSDCSCAEYAAANPEECITEPPVEPPETGGGGGGGGGMMGAFTPFLAGISYTPQAVPEPPAPPQKDYMAELDNLIKRSLFEGMA